MNSLFLIVVLACLLPCAAGADATIQWCYHDPSCNDTQWPTIAADFCNGSRQSPVDIVTANAVNDSTLVSFTFNGFDDKTASTKISNSDGKTVKVDFASGRLSVSGGALNGTYDTLQFHLHWGNRSSVPGSEHTVDGKQYPMELHIVNAKSIYNGDLTQVLADGEGLAALGFFIEVDSGTTDQPASWKALTDHLMNITEKDQYVNITGISMNELVSGVDTTSYYRYLGSLTTPACNEAVVWTVFKDTVKVSQNLIDLFSTTVRINDTSSQLMTDVYRHVQPLNGRTVRTTGTVQTTHSPTTTTTTTTAAAGSGTTSFATKSLLALGLAALHPLLGLGWGNGGW